MVQLKDTLKTNTMDKRPIFTVINFAKILFLAGLILVVCLPFIKPSDKDNSDVVGQVVESQLSEESIDTLKPEVIKPLVISNPEADTSIIKAQIQKIQSSLISKITPEQKSAELKKTTNIFASGDTMVGRYVETLMNRNGAQYPFSEISSHIKQHEIAFTNLEGPIPVTHRQTADFTTNFSFKPETVSTLKEAGFNLVTLANNHTADKGIDNLANTRTQLESGNVNFFGDPLAESDSYTLHQEVNGQHIIWLGFHDATRRLDIQKATESVSLNNQQYPEAVIFVSVHWGPEYQLSSYPRQQEVGHSLIDAGADFIIGHHPHVVQDVEVYNGKPIFYSLGNFVFDQYFSRDTQEGLTLSLEVGGGTIKTKVEPIQIVKSQAKLMDQNRKPQFMKELADRSTPEYYEQILAGELVSSY